MIAMYGVYICVLVWKDKQIHAQDEAQEQQGRLLEPVNIQGIVIDHTSKEINHIHLNNEGSVFYKLPRLKSVHISEILNESSSSANDDISSSDLLSVASPKNPLQQVNFNGDYHELSITKKNYKRQQLVDTLKGVFISIKNRTHKKWTGMIWLKRLLYFLELPVLILMYTFFIRNITVPPVDALLIHPLHKLIYPITTPFFMLLFKRIFSKKLLTSKNSFYSRVR